MRALWVYKCSMHGTQPIRFSKWSHSAIYFYTRLSFYLSYRRVRVPLR